MFHGVKQLQSSDPLTISSTAQEVLGAVGMTQDGRVFRYVEAGGTDLDPGKLCVAATQAANHENMAVASAASANATQVTVTLGATAVSANDYAGGYLVVNDEAGEGIAYRVSGHPAADASASLVVTLDPSNPIQVALTTSSQASLVKNPHKDVVVSVTDQADLPVGVPLVTLSADNFGWVQVQGVCSVLADENVTAGAAVTIGTGVAGAVEAADAAGEPQVGTALQALVDTEYRAVKLDLPL